MSHETKMLVLVILGASGGFLLGYLLGAVFGWSHASVSGFDLSRPIPLPEGVKQEEPIWIGEGPKLPEVLPATRPASEDRGTSVDDEVGDC